MGGCSSNEGGAVDEGQLPPGHFQESSLRLEWRLDCNQSRYNRRRQRNRLLRYFKCSEVASTTIQRRNPQGVNMVDLERYDALRASRLAAELTDEQCRTLAAEIELLDLSDKQVLVREGAADDHLYAVVAGELGVVRHPQGEAPTTLHTLIAGDLAGELSFIDGSERYASLEAHGPTRVLSLTRERLESLLDREPHIVYHVMRAIIRIAHQIQRRLSAQSIELANYIYKQHGRY
jgi:CRP/FNR family transcriptional regulator, cyclic AMP receptor protein